MTPNQPATETHRNDEREVVCPVEGCDATPLARGAHLHVMRSDGNGHGPQGEVPDDIDFDDLDTAGTREVSMDYPTERDNESVARICPYCGKPANGKEGVMIHLGLLEGKKNHPENASDIHEPEDFAIVHLDDDDNIVEIVEPSNIIPEGLRDRDDIDNEVISSILATLKADGMDNEAEKVKRMLL